MFFERSLYVGMCQHQGNMKSESDNHLAYSQLNRAKNLAQNTSLKPEKNEHSQRMKNKAGKRWKSDSVTGDMTHVTHITTRVELKTFLCRVFGFRYLSLTLHWNEGFPQTTQTFNYTQKLNILRYIAESIKIVAFIPKKKKA